MTGLPVVSQADTDAQLINIWANRHASPHTRRNYKRQAGRFLAYIQSPLGTARLGDVQAFLATMEDAAPATRANAVACLKSLFSFAQETGYITYNVGKVLKTPPVKNTLAERIMDEGDVIRLIHLEPNARNRSLLAVLYLGGLRISEVCRLCWRDLSVRGDAGQITVYGKGGKTRVILLPASTWRLLLEFKGVEPRDPSEPVFRSRKNGKLDESAAHRIVKAAAKRAGLPGEVSAHWLRHAHASHSLDRGAPIHLVQATLGHASVATTGRYLHARPSDSSSRYLRV